MKIEKLVEVPEKNIYYYVADGKNFPVSEDEFHELWIDWVSSINVSRELTDSEIIYHYN